MKTIGLIGGMSWNSSIEYYRIINKKVMEKLGKSYSAKSIMYSVDFEEIEKLQLEGSWKTLTNIMIDIAKTLEKAGADFLVICTNTMHKMADDVELNVHIPLLHIVDVTAEKIKAEGMVKVGLLGTKFTMEQDFYKNRLREKHAIEVLIPNEQERQIVHDIIYREFTTGTINQSPKENFIEIIYNLAAAGAEGIILGCTELPLFIKQDDCVVPLLDTTTIHAEAAVEYALQ